MISYWSGKMNAQLVVLKNEIHADKNHHLGVDIQHLIAITNQKRYRMPSGLSREERRAWAKNNQKTSN